MREKHIQSIVVVSLLLLTVWVLHEKLNKPWYDNLEAAASRVDSMVVRLGVPNVAAKFCKLKQDDSLRFLQLVAEKSSPVFNRAPKSSSVTIFLLQEGRCFLCVRIFDSSTSQLVRKELDDIATCGTQVSEEEASKAIVPSYPIASRRITD